MAKTAEELNAIREQYQALAGQMKELSEDELFAVVGGRGGEESLNFMGCHFSGKVEMEDVKADVWYFFTSNVSDDWFYGKVTQSSTLWYPETLFGFFRTHIVNVTVHNGVEESRTMSFLGRNCTAYQFMAKVL